MLSSMSMTRYYYIVLSYTILTLILMAEKLVKGSKAAKERMAALRRLRKPMIRKPRSQTGSMVVRSPTTGMLLGGGLSQVRARVRDVVTIEDFKDAADVLMELLRAPDPRRIK